MNPDSGTRRAIAALGLGVAYFVGAKVGFALTAQPTPVSTLWPPNAILLGALLLAPVRSWPLLIAAVLPAHLLVELGSGIPVTMALSWFVSNCSEALIGAAAIRWRLDRPIRLDSVYKVSVFVLGGALLAPGLSSFLDAAFVAWNGWGTAGYWDVFSARFFSNVLSILIIVPAMVTWGNHGLRIDWPLVRARAVEAGALAISFLVVVLFVFEEPRTGLHTTPALLYAPLPFLLWAAVRFGPAGASAHLLALALVSVWGAIHGRGPFTGASVDENVLALQLFLIVTYVPLMTLSAAIAERARADEAARRSARQLSVALNAAELGAWDWDIQEDRATASSEFRAILGLPENMQEISYGRFLSQVTHGDDRSSVEAGVARAIERDSAYESEFRINRSDGEVRWVHAKGAVVRDETGRAVRMVGVTADVTSRHAAETALRNETALRQSEARLRKLADAMPQIVFTASPDGHVDYFNRKWYELTGMAAEPILDQSWVNVLHPDDRPGCLGAWRENVRLGRPHEHEGRFWNERTQSYRWHLSRALPVRNADGVIVRWYGTATDINDHKHTERALLDQETELRALSEDLDRRVAERTAQLVHANASLRAEIDMRVRTEGALRASEERFAKAFRASPDVIAIAYHPSTRILEVNERWERLFGYSRMEAIGRTVHDLRIYANQRDADRLAQCVAVQGYIREFEIDMRDQSGGVIRAVLAAETVAVDGEPCLILMIRDITERRQAEAEIEMQRRQLAHLGRVAVLGELSVALAHELNQPLTAILANARAAQRMLTREPLDGDELRAILEDIVADDLRAGAVIHRVRGLIRKGDAEPQRIMPNEVVGEVLDLAHSDLIQRAVTVITRLSPTLSVVSADRVQLQQVLLNLLVNACDAMTDNTPPERILTITTVDEPGGVRVSVSDRGTGITNASVDSVFEPFVTSKEHGLGLGLAICRSIVKAHGGRMWAVNNKERGATFHLVLPRGAEVAWRPEVGATAHAADAAR